MDPTSQRCVWCGARPFHTPNGDTEWVITIAGAGCDHELLNPPPDSTSS